MNSPAKYLPLVVFTVGLLLLVYSMITFFRGPIDMPAPAPRKSPPVASDEGLEPPPREEAEDDPMPYVLRGTRPEEEASHADEQYLKDILRPAEEYLADVGLTMQLPTDFYYEREEDGPVRILRASSGDGDIQIHFFSLKERHKPERAKGYLDGYFSDEMRLNGSNQGQSYRSRAALRDMTAFRGTTSLGDDYLYYFFVNPKTNSSHVIFFEGKQLSRQPAKLRQFVDSIEPAGRAKR